MSNSLDPDQAKHFVGPDLVPNCQQMTLLEGACLEMADLPVQAMLTVLEQDTLILA